MTENNEQVQENNAPDGAENNTEGESQQDSQEQNIYRSQEEFDAAFSKRLERERKKLQQELKQQAEEEARKAKMDETERLKAEKEEAETRAAELREVANVQLIRAEAKVQAVGLGLRDEAVEAALKLADFKEVEVDENGDPDVKAVKGVLEATVKAYPFLKPEATNVGGSGSNPANNGGSGTGQVTQEQFSKMNYQERVALYNRDPELYNQLSAG